MQKTNTYPPNDLKVALVHDFLVQEGGAENVFAECAKLFPNAPIFTLISDEKKAARVYTKNRIISSWLQKLPGSKRAYQWYLPFMPRAIESFSFHGFDVVIASSSAFAKGVITPADTPLLCYCHTPTRYLWTDTHEYITELKISAVIKKILPSVLHRIRLWDYLAAQRPDVFIANSKNVQRRIAKYYRRDSSIIYPPVAIEKFARASSKRGARYFLAGGRLVSYKRFDIIIDAFNKLNIPLKIFGRGVLEGELKKRAKKNITFLGWVTEKNIPELYAGAEAFINPQEEDFGITMVEAIASGCPVIAYKRGGALEIVRDGVNGIFISEQSWEALADAVVRFDRARFDTNAVRDSAYRFRTEAFHKEIISVIERTAIKR